MLELHICCDEKNLTSGPAPTMVKRMEVRGVRQINCDLGGIVGGDDFSPAGFIVGG